MKAFYSKIKKLTILNPKKRDGGIFSYYLDEDDNIHFGDEAYSKCLDILGSISSK